jgi:branched-chain amino acid aminotransferase
MSVVWLNGALLAADSARIDPADRGFTLGDGVFETIRAASGRALHADRHLARLRQGATVLGIDVPFGDDILRGGFCDVLRENAMADAALRITLTRGPAPRGVLPSGTARPTVLISAGAFPARLPPARVVVAQKTRRNQFSPLSRIKSLNYLDSVLARAEAASVGADDALLLNTTDFLAEATASTVFLYIGDRFVTPRLEDGALPGIARGLLLEAGVGRPEQLSMQDMASAQAGFLVNSLGWRVLAHIDSIALHPAHEALGVIGRILNGRWAV